MSFISTLCLASSTSMTWASPATGLQSSRVFSVLEIQTSSSFSACWNWPRRSRAFSSSRCRSTRPLRRAVQRRLMSSMGSRIARA
uniref:Putative secreted protein n=1 Tax=Ixodes ricinus TaxID=34613 RepID=A0A6B0U3S6_IXORI